MAARGYSASTSEREAARFSSELKKQVTRTTSDGSAPAAFTTCLRRASDFAVSGATGSSGPSEAAACAEKNTRPFGFTPRLPAATASRTTCAPASGRAPAPPTPRAGGGGGLAAAGEGLADQVAHAAQVARAGYEGANVQHRIPAGSLTEGFQPVAHLLR